TESHCRTYRAVATTSARPARQDPEERLDVGVGAQVAVVVEVDVAGWAAGAREAREEGLDVRLGADVTIAVEVGAAAGEGDHLEDHAARAGWAQDRGGAEVELAVLVTPHALEELAEVAAGDAQLGAEDARGGHARD